MECGRLPLKWLTATLIHGIYTSLCNVFSSRLTKVPTDLLQVNGLCPMWFGYKTTGLLCLCSEESSCHAVTFPMQRTVRQATEGSIWPKAREKWGPQFNTPVGTGSCNNHTKELGNRPTHPLGEPSDDRSPGPQVAAVCCDTLNQRALLSSTWIWTHRNCGMINIIVLSHEALGSFVAHH